MIRLALAAILLALAGCASAPERSAISDAQKEHLMNGWAAACLFSPAYYASPNGQEGPAINACVEEHFIRYRHWETKEDAEATATVANICWTAPGMDTEVYAEQLAVFSECYEQRIDMATYEALAARWGGGGSSLDVRVDHGVRVGTVRPNYNGPIATPPIQVITPTGRAVIY